MCGVVITVSESQQCHQPEIEVSDIVLKPLPFNQFRVVGRTGACTSAEACHREGSAPQAAMAAAA